MCVPRNRFERVRALLMAAQNRDTTLTRPASVAIHDDGQMMWWCQHVKGILQIGKADCEIRLV